MKLNINSIKRGVYVFTKYSSYHENIWGHAIQISLADSIRVLTMTVE